MVFADGSIVRPLPRLILANPKRGSPGAPNVPVPVYICAVAPANWRRLVVKPPPRPSVTAPLLVKVPPSMLKIKLLSFSVAPTGMVTLPYTHEVPVICSVLLLVVVSITTFGMLP